MVVSGLVFTNFVDCGDWGYVRGVEAVVVVTIKDYRTLMRGGASGF